MGSNKNTPGPGAHGPDFMIVKRKAPLFGFGSETRSSLEGKNLSPGPGNYKIAGIVGTEGNKNSIHGLIDYTPEMKENSFKPGPGNYDPDIFVSKKKMPAYKLGTSTRQDGATRTKSKYSVSPDRYNPKHCWNSTIQSSSKWGFGSEARNSMEAKGNKCVPGAGTYKIPSRIGEGAKYVMGCKL